MAVDAHEQVLSHLGKLPGAKRSEQQLILNQLFSNLDGTTKKILRAYFGFLFQRLLNGSPKRACAKLLVAITDSSMVLQSRVNRLCAAYDRDPHPAIGALIRTMRVHSPPEIYIPPTGLESAEYAQIPSNVAAKLRENDLDTLLPLYTRVATTLQQGTPTSNANVLAQLYPLAAAGNHLLLPIEEYCYQFLRTWDGTPSPVVTIMLKYLRFWPDIGEQRLKKLLLAPLSRTSNPASMIPEIIRLGARGEYLMATLCTKLKAISPRICISIVLYYDQTGLVPPSDILYRLITEFPGGLFLCRQWAHGVAEIKTAIQGESTIATILGDSTDYLALANNPWLGIITHTTFEEVTDEPCRALITEKELEKANLDYQDFCNYLLDNLAKLGLYIDEYLV